LPPLLPLKRKNNFINKIFNEKKMKRKKLRRKPNVRKKLKKMNNSQILKLKNLLSKREKRKFYRRLQPLHLC
jgi:hypothetical protein